MGKPNVKDVRVAKQLALNLANYRKATNQSQTALARSIGVDKETISRFERGTMLPSLLTLEKLGDQLAVPIAALLGSGSAQIDEMAGNLATMLSEIDEQDRMCIYDNVKTWCEYFKKRGAPVEKRNKETRPWSTKNPDPDHSEHVIHKEKIKGEG